MSLLTLSIDCGGLSIKASVLDEAGTLHAQTLVTPTPYPLSPDLLLKTFQDIANQLPKFDRITIGFPGMVRHGVIIYTPHYVNVRGPRSKVDPKLAIAWRGLDLQRLVGEKFNLPTLVMNDAEVHGAGVVAGTGFEVMLTLGTGLGCAIFDGGRLLPHIELSHAPIRRGTIYDEWIGEHERRRLGDTFWSRRVKTMVADLRPVFQFDRLYIGGGNSRRIKSEVVSALGDDIVIVSNDLGVKGGARAWKLLRY